MHPSMRSPIRLFTHPFTHSFIHRFIYVSAHSLFHSFIRSFTHSSTRSFSAAHVHSCTRSVTHSFVHRRYWLCAGTQKSIKIWDLESKSVVEDVQPKFDKTYKRKAVPPNCTSLAWAADGATLFAGFSDGVIHVYQVPSTL